MKLARGFFLLAFAAAIFADEYQLDLLRTIGDDRPDYTLFLVSDAKMTEGNFRLKGDGALLFYFGVVGSFHEKGQADI